MRTSDQATALRNPTAHAFVRGVGYLFIGAPAININPIYGVGDCQPPLDTPDGSMHHLQTPNNGPLEELRYERNLWWPALGRGRRLAFTPAYLAAHGWKYFGSVVV